MSIYPVRLNDWFPKGDSNHIHAKIMVKYHDCLKCGKNGKKVNYKLAWGNGDMWCTTKCYKKWQNK